MRVALVRSASILRVGLRAIARAKMRSFLTVLGIVLGTGCVIATFAIGRGASQAAANSIAALGQNFIMIFPGAVTQGGARIFSGQSTLTEDDAFAIKQECPAVAYVSPTARTAAQIVAGELNWSTTIQGANPDWPFIRSWNLSEGAFFTESDVKSANKVAIVGQTVLDNLFPNGGAVGASIRIKNVPFRVVGVLEKKGGSQMGQDQDDTIVVPYTTVMKRLQGSNNRLQMIVVSAVAPDMVDDAKAQIEALLRQRHRIGPGQDSDFMMRSQDEISGAAQAVTATISMTLAIVAAISLLVGGIGIMNIMLVSVTERTREIGIRLAIGAKARHVLAQFLLEAVILSLVGGLIGIGLGYFAGWVLEKTLQWAVAISPFSIALSFGVSGAIGIFFGFFPAWKASRLDPIEALRYE